MEGRSVRRGEVYLLDFQEAGGRLRKRRPGVVVQNDQGNHRGLDTIVAAVRALSPKGRLPVHVLVRQGTAGLDKDSVIDAGHLGTVRQSTLGPRLGVIPPPLMDEVDRALKISLGLRR